MIGLDVSSEVLDLITGWVTQHWGPSPATAADQQESR
jgi:hypothetical protein